MELHERFARGEMDAFEALFRAHQADVYRWCLRIVRDHAAAEDVTMDAFHRAWRSHAHFDPGGNFSGWMRRIATNLALDYLRAAKRNVPLDDQAPERGVSGGNPAVRREQREKIAAAFAELAPKLRVVATLALIEDVPYAEIGDALGISEGAARVRAHRAIALLRDKLKPLRAS
jgi:RNA polymerase sigma-70 factor (ECF subfamily)